MRKQKLITNGSLKKGKNILIHNELGTGKMNKVYSGAKYEKDYLLKSMSVMSSILLHPPLCSTVLSTSN